MRRAARIDATQDAVVSALRAAGASVTPIGQPVDLLVGYRLCTYLLEVKNPKTGYGKRGANKLQKDFMEQWRGAPVALVYDAEAALKAIGAIAWASTKQ